MKKSIISPLKSFILLTVVCSSLILGIFSSFSSSSSENMTFVAMGPEWDIDNF